MEQPSFSFREARSEGRQRSFLPNFCANRVVFMVVLIAELLALALTLNPTQSLRDFWYRLALTSLFIQWVALGSASVLCWNRRWLEKTPALWATLVAYAITQGMTVIFSWFSLGIISYYSLSYLPMPIQPWQYCLQNLAISSVVCLAALRYFYIQHQWKINLEAEARARFRALQARIRPHFLFNALNAVAGIVRNHPDRAEQAILDLAELFRSVLEQRDRISLGDELRSVHHYLAIEALRLGDRLQVDYQWSKDIAWDMLIPPLIFQPLVENAVYHGIQLLPEGGKVTISLTMRHHKLVFAVSNPTPVSYASAPLGSQLAQDNIRQRLALAYGEAGVMRIQKQPDWYEVVLSLPTRLDDDDEGIDR